VILLSGEQLWLIKQCCQMARLLSPTLVIMEDVDLIASARDEHRHPMYQITLHQLLNEMDGLASDAQVLFLLTTNRPEALEDALVARPGRIDQAIEYPLPDAECRRRLFELFGRGLDLQLQDRDGWVARTDGASPAFLQELVRKAALVSAVESSTQTTLLQVVDGHLDTALKEMLASGDLTRRLFGFRNDPDGNNQSQP
jgi:ATP-dependent 26S proteasome regulatory subunit